MLHVQISTEKSITNKIPRTIKIKGCILVVEVNIKIETQSQ